MQALALAEGDHLLARDGEARAQRRVARVRVGHDGIESVVAALQLDEDEEAPRRGRRRGAREPRHAGEGHEGGEPEEIASVHGPHLSW
jgi:hypothetical protein